MKVIAAHCSMQQPVVFKLSFQLQSQRDMSFCYCKKARHNWNKPCNTKGVYKNLLSSFYIITFPVWNAFRKFMKTPCEVWIIYFNSAWKNLDLMEGTWLPKPTISSTIYTQRPEQVLLFPHIFLDNFYNSKYYSQKNIGDIIKIVRKQLVKFQSDILTYHEEILVLLEKINFKDSYCHFTIL